MTTLLRNGSKGDEVRSLQEKLTRLGYALEADGHFGPTTEKTVRELQRVFGYTADGIVGDGTTRLIDQQINYGWNATAPDAEEHGLRAQGKAHEADALRARREASGNASKQAASASKQAPPGKQASPTKS
ncbi:MAG: peptidoglycan-binding protein [Deltaproteobacteria bacterium]|nr:peptidoglycan-binding protein [Deltaproteobacteria bacterium]